MTVLWDFLKTSNDIEELRELLKNGEDPNIRESGATPLIFAIYTCKRNLQDTDYNLQAARELINFGANVDLAEDLQGQTPLQFAVLFVNYKMTELLLEANARINAQDRYGNAALHHADEEDCHRFPDEVLGIVKLLLKYKPDVDLRNYDGQTPLMLASESTNIQIIKELLKNNASVNLQDSKGNTALYYALRRSDVDVNIVLELMRHGCSFNMSNDFMASYIRRHCYQSYTHIEEVKHLFKLFAFDRYHFSYLQLMRMIELSMELNIEISQFLELCAKEIELMRLDELAPCYSFYDITLRSLFSRSFENSACYISPDDIYKVIDKLIKGHYPLYCDIVVSGVCSPYMNKRFAEVCCNISKLGVKFLNYDWLYRLSFYLSELDMLNTMIACSD